MGQTHFPPPLALIIFENQIYYSVTVNKRVNQWNFSKKFLGVTRGKPQERFQANIFPELKQVKIYRLEGEN